MIMRSMDTTNMEAFRKLLERADLALSQREIERLKPIFEQFMLRLKVLYSAPLDDEEVAHVFSPEWTSDS